MASNEKINVKVTAQDQASRKLKKLDKQMNTTKTVARGLATAFVAAFGVLATKMVVDFGKKAIDAYGKEEQALARLTAALKNQNQYTAENIQALQAQASALQNQTTFADESILSAQAMLGSFALTTDQIKEMTPRMLDLATMTAKTTGGQMDLEQAAKFVGMALGGQAGRLTQAGIRLTDFQKKQFLAANEQQRFNMLLKIFDQNARGLATSVGRTATGAMERFSNITSDVMEKIGKELAPLIVDDLLPALEEMLPTLLEVSKSLIQFTKAVADAMRATIGWINSINRNLDRLEKQDTWLGKLIKRGRDGGRAIAELSKSQEEATVSADGLTASTEAFTGAQITMSEEAVAAAIALEEQNKKTAAEIDKAYSRIGESFRQNVVDNITEGTLTIENLFKDLANAILNAMLYEAFIPIAKAATELGRYLGEVLFGASRGGAGGGGGGGGTSIGKTVGSLIGGAIGGPVGSLIGGLLGGLLPFAEGGIVTQPTVALIGEKGPEAVVPLNRATGVGTTIVINAGAFMGNQADARNFAKMIDKELFYLQRTRQAVSV